MKKVLFFGLGLISLVVLNVFGMPYLFDGVQTNEGGDTLATLTELRSSKVLTATQENNPLVLFVPTAYLIQIKNGKTAGYATTNPEKFVAGSNVEYVAQVDLDIDSILLEITFERTNQYPYQRTKITTENNVVTLPKFTVKAGDTELEPLGFFSGAETTNYATAKRDTLYSGWGLEINDYPLNNQSGDNEYSILDSSYYYESNNKSESPWRGPWAFPYQDSGSETYKVYYVFNTQNIIDLKGSLEIDFTDPDVGQCYGKTGVTEIYNVVLSKTEALARQSTLKQLHFTDSIGGLITIWEGDEIDDYFVGFNENVFDYGNITIETVNDYTLVVEPRNSSAKVEVEVDGFKIPCHNENHVLKNFTLPKAGGTVEIIVTAPNQIDKSTYKFTYDNYYKLPAVDPTKKAEEERYKYAKTFLSDLFIYNATDTFKLHGVSHQNKQFKDVGGYYWNNPDSNLYVAALPNPNDLTLQLGSTFHRPTDFIGINKVVLAKEIDVDNNVSWLVKIYNIENNTQVYADTVGAQHDGAEGGSILATHKIELKSNDNYLSSLAYRFDSITAETHTVNFNKDTLVYGDLVIPSTVRNVYVYAPRQTNEKEKVTVTIFGGGAQSVKRYGGIQYDDWYKYENVSADKFIPFQENAVKLSVTSDAGKLRDYFLKFHRLPIFELDSVIIKEKGTDYIYLKNPNSSTENDEGKKRSLSELLKNGHILSESFSYEDGDELTIKGIDVETSNKDIKNKVITTTSRTTPDGDDFISQLTLKDTKGNIQRYSFKIYAPKSITTLSELFTSPSGLKPSFDPDITSYELIVPDNTTKVSFYGELTDPRADAPNLNKSFDFSGDSLTYNIVVTSSNKKVKGTYSILVKTESFEEEGGQTGISKISNSSYVSYDNNTLTVSTSSIERVYVLSTLGQLITTFDKSSGSISIPFNQKGIFILNGSSGWVSKILVK